MKAIKLWNPNNEDGDIVKHNVFEDNAIQNSKHAISKSKSEMDNSFALFLADRSLYEQYIITDDNLSEIASVLNGDAKIEVYCPECGANRIFYMNPVYPQFDPSDAGFNYGPISLRIENYIKHHEVANAPRPDNVAKSNKAEADWFHWGRNDRYLRVVDFPFHCSQEDNHIIDYIVIFNKDKAIKIGQYPSYADLTKPEFKKYKGLLPDEYFSELKRAVGLNSSEIGIGSYVYLRRVIEYLVNDAGEQAISDGKFTQDEWNFYGGHNRKVVEKIKMLGGYLPDFMIDNAAIYSIVSKGIHELSEEECKEYFDVLYQSIIVILDEMYEKRQKERDKKNLSSAIGLIKGKLKG